MGWKERSHEDFSSGLGDLLSTPGNGTVSVTGGKLRLYTPLAANCDYWVSSSQFAPRVYRDLGHYQQSGSGIYMVEFGIVSRNHLSGSNTYSAPMLILEKDAANYRLMQGPYLDNTDWFAIGRIEADVWYQNFQGDWSGRYLDGWYRIYVNGGKKRIWLGYTYGWLEPGKVGLGFSRTRADDPNNDPSAWNDDIWIYDAPELLQDQSVDSLSFKLVQKSWSSQPETELLVEDLYVYEWQFDDLQLDGDPTKDGERGATRSVGVSDELEASLGGEFILPPGHAATPPTQSDKAPAAAVGMEDSYSLGINAPTVPQQERPNFPYKQSALAIGEISTFEGDRTHRQMSMGMEDATVLRVDQPAQFRPDTLDPEAHPHFVGLNPYAMFYYRTNGEPWANPVAFGFTGYARDGTHYTAGVQDAGPVLAPWAQEFVSGNRSARDDFPLEALLVVTNDELVIFDLDNWPTTLGVWMRFEIHSTDYYMLGRYDGYVTSVSMANGTMAVSVRENGTDRGGIILVDFKQDGTQHCAHLIRSDNHWWWSSGFDIRDRNTASKWTTSGVPISLRVNSEYTYSVSIYDDHNGKSWVASAGEDYGPQVLGLEAGIPQWMGYANGPLEELGEQNVGNTRRVLFDESGWLWYSIENRLYRAVFDYKGGVMQINQRGTQRGVTFVNETIRDLAQGRNYVYVGTDRGVFRVHKGSLKANLAYTIAGGGGGGFADVPPNGELLIGSNPRVNRLHCVSTDKSSILQVTTFTDPGLLGGVTTIRLTDDFILGARKFPDIPEDQVFVGVSTVGV